MASGRANPSRAPSKKWTNRNFFDQVSHHLNEPLPDEEDYSSSRFAKESLSIQTLLTPTAWMGRLKTAIENRPLRSVILPGAHDCATYSLTNKSRYGSDLQSVKALRALSAIGLGKVTRGIVATWAICQSADTETQLQQGVRYFDLRIASLNDSFYIWHGLCGDPAETVFVAMADYARKHPTEILILDLWPHHFNNFQLHHHKQFCDMLIRLFGDMLCRTSVLNPWSTVGQFWASKTNVICIYAPPEPNPEHGDVWWSPTDCLDSYWPNHCKNPEHWLKWAAVHVRERPTTKPLWVLQGVITPDAGIITKFNGVGSIADLAHRLNPKAVHFLTETANFDHNIVMLDFYDNCTIIEAIYWCNMGGQPIFSNLRGFGATVGHYCHLRVLPIIRANASKNSSASPNNSEPSSSSVDAAEPKESSSLPEYTLVAIAMSNQSSWHTATMSRSRPLPWIESSGGPMPINHVGSNIHAAHTMRMFHMCDGTAYCTLSLARGAVVLRYDFSTESWAEYTTVREFGNGSGLEVPSPIYRSTFAATSATEYGKPAFITALTVLGLTVSTLNPNNTVATTVSWAPPISMLEPYFTLYAPQHVRRYFTDHHLLRSSADASNGTNSDMLMASQNAKRQSVTFAAHTQVKPFVLRGKLFLFVQAPVSAIFRRAPSMYETEAMNFICAVEGDKFTPLALEGIPPPTFHGSTSMDGADERLFGSVWHIETVSSGSAYFICRSSLGIRSWKFDGETMSELPLYRAFTDEFHWHESPYCFGLRTFVLEDRVFFMGRSSVGLMLITLQDEMWIPWPGMAEFSDFNGWASEEATKSIHVTVAGAVAYVTGRSQFGIVTVCFDGADWTHFERPVILPDTNALEVPAR